MNVRGLLAALAVACVLSGCQTLGGGGIQQSDKSFATDEDFRQWFAYYYRDPHPEELTAALKYMESQHYLADFPDVAGVFLGRVFVANPDSLEGWAESWQPLSADAWNVLLVGLWMTNTEQSKKLITANLSHVPAERQERIKEMMQHDPADIDPLTADVVDPRQINLIWAAFSATGDERYIHKVIGYVHLYGDTDDERRGMIGEAALMTLANNSLQHESVARICNQEDAANPDPRTRLLLKAMLSALAQLQHESDGQVAPAH